MRCCGSTTATEARSLNTSLRRRLLLLILLLAAVAAGAAWWRAHDTSSLTPRASTLPAGAWNLPRGAARLATDEETARLLSLPYLAGRYRAEGAAGGVLGLDEERAQPGWNLIVSGHAPEVVLADLEGRSRHRWRMTFPEAFPGERPREDAHYFRRARLLPDGGLVAIYQGSGMVRLDRDSRLLWTWQGGTYNDVRLGPDGRIYTLTKRLRPDGADGQPRLEDFVVVLSPEGRVEREVSLLEAVLASPLAATVAASADARDVLHSNTVRPLDGSLAGVQPLWTAGRVLVSMRHLDLLGILDLDRGDLVWARQGAWRRQHEPAPLPDGRLVVFDNQGGGDDSARVLWLNLPDGGVAASYGGPPDHPLISPEAGVVQPLPNGNLLIVASESGRALEIDEDGTVVWEFRTPHRAGQQGELVATLFDVVRLDPGVTAGWLDATNEEPAGP